MANDNAIDITQYRYYPEDRKKLMIEAIIRKMRDLRLFYIFAIPVWAAWGLFSTVFFFVLLPESMANNVPVIRTATIFIWLIIPLVVMIALRLIIGHTDKRKDIMRNAHKYLSNVGNDFMEQLQADLYSGLKFMKKYNLVISHNYVIGSISDSAFNLMAIPKEQIKSIAYVYYYQPTVRYTIVEQKIYFRLKNGKEVMMPVRDRYNIGLTLKALEECGVPIIDITREKRSGKR